MSAFVFPACLPSTTLFSSSHSFSYWVQLPFFFYSWQHNSACHFNCLQLTSGVLGASCFGQRWWAIETFSWFLLTNQFNLQSFAPSFSLSCTFHHWTIGLLNLQYMELWIWICTILALLAFQYIVPAWPFEQWTLRVWLSLRPQIHLEFDFQWMLTVSQMIGLWFQLLPQRNEVPPKLFQLRFVEGRLVLNNLLNEEVVRHRSFVDQFLWRLQQHCQCDSWDLSQH